MQLTYRGIQYNHAPVSLPTIASQHKATYRGVTYTILPSQPAAALPANLKYRGVTYAQNSVKAPEMVYQPVSRPAMA